MIKEQRITDIHEIWELISAIEIDSECNRYRSSFLFRGLPNSDYKLDTSLHRNCSDKQYDLESSILRNFIKYTAIEDPELKESIWRQLIIGQHHGLPTRLMDWTYSLLIGLHFATSGEDLPSMDQHDCVLWRIDISELNDTLPSKYKMQLDNNNAKLLTVDMLSEVVADLTTYDTEMGDRSMVLLEPPSIDHRIINQYSYFSITPRGITDIENFLATRTEHTVKFIIDKNLRWKIRDILDQLNINERTVFPGLDGISAWLKRHYYVK